MTILMTEAAEDGDYDTAHEYKLERDEILTMLALEEKLFHECTWAKGYAEEKICQLQKMQDYLKCQQFANLLGVTSNYLETVADEDINEFVFNCCLQLLLLALWKSMLTDQEKQH